MNTRLAAAFRGNAQCRPETGAIQWCIRGLDRDSGAALEVLLSGAAGLQLPADLPGAELHVRDESASASWEFRAGGQVYPLPVRSVQVHRGCRGGVRGRASPHQRALEHARAVVAAAQRSCACRAWPICCAGSGFRSVSKVHGLSAFQ